MTSTPNQFFIDGIKKIIQDFNVLMVLLYDMQLHFMNIYFIPLLEFYRKAHMHNPQLRVEVRLYGHWDIPLFEGGQVHSLDSD